MLMKATFIVLLYNMIEATAVGGIREIYDHLQDNQCVIRSLNTKLIRVWLKNEAKNFNHPNLGSEKLAEHIWKLHTVLSTDQIFSFRPEELKNAFGNADPRTIKCVYSSYGIEISFEKHQEEVLHKVKGARNQLAHGEISFDECGRKYTMTDLRDMRDAVASSMQSIVDDVDKYLSGKQYLSTP